MSALSLLARRINDRTSPRYDQYAVVDAHTGAVLSVHPSRRLAEAAVTEHSHRVRGVAR